jgi:hypothetical protein
MVWQAYGWLLPLQEVGWRRRNEAVTFLYLVSYPSALMCNMETQVSTTFLTNATDQNLRWCSRYLRASFTVPQDFEHFVRLSFTYVLASKIWNYDELDPWHIIHILVFITSNFLPNCLLIIAALAIFQAWIWLGVGVGKLLYDYVLKTFSPRKVNILGACLHLTACNIALL